MNLSSELHNATIGVFGTDREAKAALESAIAKKSEADGILVYHRTEAGRRFSFLDTTDFPERIQGYARIASISDHAYYLFPKSGRLTPPDGELAILLEAFGVPGTVQLLDGTPPDVAKSALRGTRVAGFAIEERSSVSSVLDVTRVSVRPDFPTTGTLIYVDRAFTVKGVGTVALGFVLSGKVSLHDQLRLIPGPEEQRSDVRGIQINDVDFETAGRGVRVGLSLRGVEPKDLEKCHWLDDGTFRLASNLALLFERSAYYKQGVEERELHLQLPGEALPARLEASYDGTITASLPTDVPTWNGMKVAVLDLNGKQLRVAGGATCRF